MADIAESITRLFAGSDAERAAIARELACQGETAAIALAEALAGADAEARWGLLAALAQIPGAAATRALAAVLAGDPDEGLRAAAAQILGEHGAGGGALIAALQDESVFVAQQAAHALARMGPDMAPEFIALLREGGPRARIAAARALVTIRTEDAIPALIAALEDDSPAVQFYAEQALDRLGVGTVLLWPGSQG